MRLFEFLQHLATQPEWRQAGAVTPLSRATNGDTPLHAAMGSSASASAGRHGIPLESLAQFPTTIWTAAECPLCQSGVPLERPSA